VSRAHAALVVLAALSLASASHAGTDLKVRGLLDLGLDSSVNGRELNRLSMGDSNFDPYRLRVLLDARVAPGLELHVQAIFHEGESALRADGAYALWTPWPARDLALEAGKIPLFIGTYAARTYSDQNGLGGTPLMYQYRTGLLWDEPMMSADQLLLHAGRGQRDPTRPYLPVVDERWWDTGAAFLGTLRPFEFSAGVVQGSPSWPAPGVDNTPGQSVAGRLGFVPVSGVRLGVSGADGAWMPAWFAPALPPGASVRDYRETTWMADVELARGPLEVRGEGVQRRWQTVATGDLQVEGGYAEVRWTLPCGAWLAGRGEALRFSDIAGTALVRPWDDDVDRWEGVAGYRVTRDVRVKLGVQRTVLDPSGAARANTDLLFAQLGIRF
jgi:hypothetical protein